MSAGPAAGVPRPDAVLADAARYLEDTAPQHGGRNARPLAIPVLVTTYCSTARTVRGTVAAALGALAGAAAWFGIDALVEAGSAVAAGVVGLVVAVAALVAAVLLGLRVLRGGARLVAALRRWYAVAPEVPVSGSELLSAGAGITRLVLAGIGVVGAVTALVLASLTGSPTGWVGAGVASISLLLAAALSARGWWHVRALLRGAAPQQHQEAFAPSPPPQPMAPHGWAPPPVLPEQPVPAQPVWSAAPPGLGGEPPPQPVVAAPPFAVAGAPVPLTEPDLGDTRYASDSTVSGRSRPVAVLLEDGRRLEVGMVTLVGRAPRPRPDDPAVTTIAVDDGTVSKTHAAFRVAGDSVHVTDRSSTNGTTVVDDRGDSRRLRPWAEEPVQIGSEVLLGSYRVRVVEG